MIFNIAFLIIDYLIAMSITLFSHQKGQILPVYLDHIAQSGASLTANQGVAGSSPGPAAYFCGYLS